MSGLDSFAKAKGEKRKVQIAEELSKGKGQKKKRLVEEQLLKPKKIPPYTGKKVKFTPLSGTSTKLVFPNDESFALWKKHFGVSAYVEASSYRLDPLIAFLKMLDDGSATYDKETKRLSFRIRKRGNKRSPRVGDKKQRVRSKRRVIQESEDQ